MDREYLNLLRVKVEEGLSTEVAMGKMGATDIAKKLGIGRSTVYSTLNEETAKKDKTSS